MESCKFHKNISFQLIWHWFVKIKVVLCLSRSLLGRKSIPTTGSLQESVVLFHVMIRGTFSKTARTFEAQVQ